MQLAKLKVFNKNSALTSIKRDASCSRGWVRLVVQTIFFMITVASFVMILIITIHPNMITSTPRPSCTVQYCHVECFETPYYDDRLQYIYSSLQEANSNCNQIALTLTNPYFVNGLLPSKWMGDIHANIGRLHIQGGNLHYITPGAFETSIGETIETVQFKYLIFSSLEEKSFSGLNNLIQISIENCILQIVKSKVLKPVSSTLKYLSIIDSGEWSLDSFTGSTNLPMLNDAFLIRNNFSDIIKQHTFSKIQNVESVYLNWCNIVAIQLGAFDYMDNIKTLDLSHNLLVTLPNGLFDRIVSLANLQTRINIANNLWLCDCEITEFSLFAIKGILGDEPTCNKPKIYQNMTLVDYERDICDNCSNAPSEVIKNGKSVDLVYRYKKETNISDIIKKKSLNMNSDLGFECKFSNVLNSDIRTFSQIHERNKLHGNHWLNPRVYIDSSNITILHMEVEMSNNHGMIWYEGSCPRNIYCVDVPPTNVRILNVSSISWFVFCPWSLVNGTVEYNYCIPFNVADVVSSSSCYVRTSYRLVRHVIFYSAILLSGLLTGGCSVYFILWKNPTLLRGSKRLLIVKHKEVDALVLPPKVPLRTTKSNIPFPTFEHSIFVLPSNESPLERGKSVRSNSSSAPSYVSALQPSDDQLEQWRTQRNVETESIYASIHSDISHFSSVIRRDSVTYFIVEDDTIHSDRL